MKTISFSAMKVVTPALFERYISFKARTRCTVIASFFLASTGATANTDSSAVDCLAINEHQARLACYDRLHGRSIEPELQQAAQERGKSATETPITGESVEDNPPTSASAHQLGAEQLRKPLPTSPSRPVELVTNLQAMGKSITGRHWFRLANGQLWEQVSAGRTTLREGDRIRISKGLLATYHLRRVDGGSRSTSVRRRE